MQIHERTMPVQKAQLEFNQWTLDWITLHDLTYGEVIGIFADRLGMLGKMMRRSERHPDDPDKCGDLA